MLGENELLTERIKQSRFLKKHKNNKGLVGGNMKSRDIIQFQWILEKHI